MGNPKDKDKEFILGVSQGEAIGELRIEDSRNNFVYRQYLDSHNWHDYIDSKNLDRSIDNKIRESKYRPIYETVGRIKYEDAIKHKTLWKNADKIQKQLYKIMNTEEFNEENHETQKNLFQAIDELSFFKDNLDLKDEYKED